MAKAFASSNDLEEKKITFEALAEGVYAYTAEGDPNAGVIVGDKEVMVIDTLATPVLAQTLLKEIRKVTDKPIKYITMTHYHAVRVLGAAAYDAPNIIASRNTFEWVKERGMADFKSEVGRFPRLFQGVESVPGLTWPTIVFEKELTVFMGKREIKIMHLGKGHSKGDTVVWLPKEKILFAGDLVEMGATPYCGDAFLTDWPTTLKNLKALGAKKLVPGRGPALKTKAASDGAIDGTRAFVEDMLNTVKKGAKKNKPLKQVYAEAYAIMNKKYGKWKIFEHCIPFNVARAYDEARGVVEPIVWTDKRDREMWKALQG
ncbi:MAG: MBL fold metallo-hydrolase [Alphaproteobacteria bacterium]